MYVLHRGTSRLQRRLHVHGTLLVPGVPHQRRRAGHPTYVINDDVLVVSSASQLQWNQRNASSALSDVVRRRWLTERHRQAMLIDARRQACVHYVDDLTAAIAVKLDDALTTSRRDRRRYTQAPTTVTDVVQSRLVDGLTDYDVALSRFKLRYRDRLVRDMAPSLRQFADYLASVETSQWLDFARSLFNQSVETSVVQRLLFHGAGQQRFQSAVLAAVSTTPHVLGLNVSGAAADFASFIAIEEVEEIQLWSRQFWDR